MLSGRTFYFHLHFTRTSHISPYHLIFSSVRVTKRMWLLFLGLARLRSDCWGLAQARSLGRNSSPGAPQSPPRRCAKPCACDATNCEHRSLGRSLDPFANSLHSRVAPLLGLGHRVRYYEQRSTVACTLRIHSRRSPFAVAAPHCRRRCFWNAFRLQGATRRPFSLRISELCSRPIIRFRRYAFMDFWNFKDISLRLRTCDQWSVFL